ncbi:MAG: flagellar motor switch protein FliM [Nocardioides sp.]
MAPSAERRRRNSGVVTPYDFRRPVKLSRENSRTLQIAFETFARQVSTVMTSALRSVCSVDLVDIQQATYNEYVESLGDMTHMTMFSVEPLQHSAVLEMPLAVTMTCVDQLLGGPGTLDQPERPLTDLEKAVVGGLYDRIVAEFRYAFSSIVPVEPVVLGMEYSPQLAQVANASDVMVVARFVFKRGEVEHPISLCLSFNGLIPFLAASGGADTVSDRDRALRQEASARLAAGIQEVPVEVSVRFRGTLGDPLELSGLQVGDVVRLRHPAQAPLDVTAADVVFAHATPGSQGPNLAALVVASPTQENHS